MDSLLLRRSLRRAYGKVRRVGDVIPRQAAMPCPGDSGCPPHDCPVEDGLGLAYSRGGSAQLVQLARTATLRCPEPVTLVVTGTGTGTNTLHVTGPATTRFLFGDNVVLSVTGPEGAYTIIDTDSGRRPGVF